MEKFKLEKTLGLVSRLELEPLRKVFPKEARHFTTWLESNIEAISERIGIKLEVIQREKYVGDFKVDLLCEVKDGGRVVIESQLEKTDHDHLGKLLTYLVNLDANTCIWVTADPRPEHQKVMDWLNESTPSDMSFYLVKVEAVRIGSSPFAPLFTVIAGPDRQSKEIGKKKKEWADVELKRIDFWKGLIERSKNKTKLFANITPGKNHFLSISSGKGGVTFTYVILKSGTGVELYIDHDKDTGKMNKDIFDALRRHKKNIEREFGAPLTWERLNNKRAARITKRYKNSGISDPKKWPSIQDEMINAMIRFEKAIRPCLAKISV
jgi:hypothetical protein